MIDLTSAKMYAESPTDSVVEVRYLIEPYENEMTKALKLKIIITRNEHKKVVELGSNFK